MIGFGPVEASDIAFRKLGLLHFIPVVSKGYAERNGLPTRANLAEHFFLQSELYSAKTGLWDGWNRLVACGRTAFLCDNSFAYGMLVKAGQGIGLLGSYTLLEPAAVPFGVGSEGVRAALRPRSDRSAQRAAGPRGVRLAVRYLQRQESLVPRGIQDRPSAERLRFRIQAAVQHRTRRIIRLAVMFLEFLGELQIRRSGSLEELA